MVKPLETVSRIVVTRDGLGHGVGRMENWELLFSFTK